ncbi:MAG TPA: hypothetical protein VM658_14340 [bacterium]|nr:hypothetical protein [bacterium]
MSKGCGCIGFAGAVAVGLVIGAIALFAAGYHWVNTRMLADEPESVFADKWTKLDEAALAGKLAPIALLMKQNKEGEQKVSLKGSEAGRLLDEYFTREGVDCRAAVSFGDTVTDVTFARRVREGKYLNGELRAFIKADNADFEVSVYGLRTGEFKWPKPLLVMASRWIEGTLETQALLKDMPLRIMDYDSGKDQVKLTVKVVREDKTPAEDGAY